MLHLFRLSCAFVNQKMMKTLGLFVHANCLIHGLNPIMSAVSNIRQCSQTLNTVQYK
jgi:hypothetical protein